MTSNNRGCDRQEDLITYLYGESEPEAARRFEAHARECLICARELRELSGVRDALQAWEVEAVPHIVLAPKRPWRAALGDLIARAPIWTKGLAAAAALLVLAALLNVQVSIGQNGFAFRAGLFHHNEAATLPATTAPASASFTREEAAKLVSQMLAESERRNQEELRLKLTQLSQELQKNYDTELARLTKDLRRDQRRQLDRIWQDVAARNDLSFTNLMNGIDSK